MCINYSFTFLYYYRVHSQFRLDLYVCKFYFYIRPKLKIIISNIEVIMISKQDQIKIRVKNVLEVIKTLVRQGKTIDASFFLRIVENFTRIKKINGFNNEIFELKMKVKKL